MQADDLAEITKAASGLQYPSESDAPFDVFRWPGTTSGTARDVVGSHGGAGRKIEEVAIDAFFAELIESDDGERYKRLRRALESELKDLKIFRVGVGEPKVDVYLLGRTRVGELAGLHTTSVET
jgi:hypothetical protein